MKRFEYSNCKLALLIMGSIVLGNGTLKAGEQDLELLKQNPNISRDAEQIAAGKKFLDTKETVDNGNDPGVAGCQDVYKIQNATCGGLLDRWGDFCDSKTHIMERVIPTKCTNGRQLAPVRIDCRKFLKNPKARCIKVADVCPPGNFLTGAVSARCEVPKAPIPEPIPNPTTKEKAYKKD